MIEQTFVIIKPDAINRRLVGTIIQRFEKKNLRILRIQSEQKNYAWVRLMYPNIFERLQMGKWLECEYMDFANFMISTPLIGMTLEGNNAISVVRKMIGATDSREALPGTIRGDYGTYPVMCNCVHASDSVDSASNEIKLFFGGDL